MTNQIPDSSNNVPDWKNTIKSEITSSPQQILDLIKTNPQAAATQIQEFFKNNTWEAARLMSWLNQMAILQEASMSPNDRRAIANKVKDPAIQTEVLALKNLMIMVTNAHEIAEQRNKMVSDTLGPDYYLYPWITSMSDGSTTEYIYIVSRSTNQMISVFDQANIIWAIIPEEKWGIFVTDKTLINTLQNIRNWTTRAVRIPLSPQDYFFNGKKLPPNSPVFPAQFPGQPQQRPGELDITQINNFNNSFLKYWIGMNKQWISYPNGKIMIPPNATNIGTYTDPEFQWNKNAVLSYTLWGMRFDYTVSVVKMWRNESIVVNETSQNGKGNLYTSMR